MEMDVMSKLEKNLHKQSRFQSEPYVRMQPCQIHLAASSPGQASRLPPVAHRNSSHHSDTYHSTKAVTRVRDGCDTHI